MADPTLKMLLLGEDRGASKAFRDTGEAAEDAGKKVKDSADDADVAGNRFSGLLDNVKGFAAGAVVAIGGMALGELFSQGLDFSAGQAKLDAQLGLTETQSAAAGKAAGSLFSDNYGESMGQVQEAIGLVIRDIDGMRDASTATLEDISGKALSTAQIFDQDLGGVTRAVSQMMRTGMADSAEEAFDIITAGFQKGVDKSEDFLDTFNEYSTQFRKVGLDGAESVGLLSQALQAGARDSDIAADAIKEFSIRTIGTLETTDSKGRAQLTALGQAFQDVLGPGEDMYKVQADIAAGGDRAKGALDKMLDGLRSIEDPATRSNAAVGLFGTQAEDLGDALYAMDVSTAADGLGKVAGATERANKAMNDTPSAKMQGFFRQLQGGAVEIIGGKVIPALEDMAEQMRSGEGAAGGYGKYLGFLGDIVKDVAGWVGDELLPFIDELADQFSDAMGGTEGFKDTLADLEPAGRLVKAVLGAVWEGLKWAAKAIIPGIALAIRRLAFGIGVLSKAAIWLWNNAFAPSLRKITYGIGVLMATWAAMLRALGKVPGFGWARDAANKMQGASDKAFALSRGIKDIPAAKKVRVDADVRGKANVDALNGALARFWNYNGRVVRVTAATKYEGQTRGSQGAWTARAVGGYTSGGMVKVGERGEEFVELPRGSYVHTAAASERMARTAGGDNITININGAQNPVLVGREVEKALATRRREKNGGRLDFETAGR